jgi:hypothetical protein
VDLLGLAPDFRAGICWWAGVGTGILWRLSDIQANPLLDDPSLRPQQDQHIGGDDKEVREISWRYAWEETNEED